MTRRATLFVFASVVTLGGTALRAAEPAELRKLFPHEADVTIEREGLHRLVLPAEVLRECRPDLSDVRLFDAEGREMAYLVDRATDDAVEVSQRFAPPVLALNRTEERRTTGPPLRRETYELGLPSEAPQTGNWVLLVDVRHREFVAQLEIATLRAAGASTTALESASVFRLTGPRSASRTRIALPPFDGERLRVVVVSEEPSWIEPSFVLESARSIDHGGRLDVPLETIASRSVDGRTVVDLLRPRGIVPDLLRLETETPTFDRRVEVWDDGPGASATALGSADLFRIEAIARAGVDEVALEPPRGDRLRVEIADGDSPPLAGSRWIAVVRQPALVFSTRGNVTLRFGGGRSHRPSYDLERLLPRVSTGERARAAAALYDATALGTARVGPVRPNRDYDGASALAFAMRPGAEIDRRAFRHVRRLRVPEAQEGLSRVTLAPADLAALEANLADLRIADRSARQWPFLIERERTHAFVPLRLAGSTRKDHTSRYVIEPDVAWLELDRLVFDSDVPFFDRTYRLLGLSGNEERQVAAGRLVRPIGDPRPVTVELPSARVRSLALLIEDGDDAPLTFRSIQARTSAPDVYLAAPPGDYDLLLGAPGAEAPRYELERVRDVVLAVRAAEIEAGTLEDNPDFSVTARLKGGGLRQTVLLWAALILAVVVLGAYTLRLARRAA